MTQSHVEYDPGHGPAPSNASVVKTGFSADEYIVQAETAAIAVAAAAKAAIEARYILALKRPRDWDVARSKLLNECKRKGFAESAIYRKPVGKKKNEETGRWEQSFVEGLSVRFAEAAIRYMTNVYTDATSIYDDPTKSIVRVTVTDLESNASIAIDVPVQKTVERRNLKQGQRAIRERVNSYGERVFVVEASDDEILNKSNALVSKALRNGILRLLPGDIQDDCEAACRQTQRSGDEKDPTAAKHKLFDAFSGLGITPDQLKSYLGTNGDTLQPAELAELRAIFAAIRDGETTWSAVIDDKPAPQQQKPAEGAEQPKSDPAASQQPKSQAQAADDLVNKHKPKAKPAEGAPTAEELAADEKKYAGK